MNRREGYRYIRTYWLKDHSPRWALYEVQRGRARRVGTAVTLLDSYTFLGCPELARQERC